MKPLPPALAAHVAEGVTTLCYCWKLERKDGVIMGFTDHDLDLTFDDVTYEAASGFTATAIEDQLGLGVSNLDVQGALSSDTITETDVNAGRYDAAEVTIFRVNWEDTAQRTIMRKGDIGQIVRGRIAYTAEMRGLAARLDQSTGRIFQRDCPWKLGDADCKVDLGVAGNFGAGAVASIISPFEFTVTGLDSITSGRLAFGKLVWTTGANAGIAVDLISHSLVAGVVTVGMMLPMGADVTVGDQFTVTAGCDGTWDTCVGVYDNAVNFGGMPHMPGDDFALTYAIQGENNDGGPVDTPGRIVDLLT